MFANLKNKLIEEVKASPSKFQQFANAAQAAVSSSSGTLPGSEPVSGNENFFSITEEDTPQNSPHKPLKLPVGSSRAKGPNISPQSNNGAIPRSRRLSNSSVASDVSFRLPAYESPAVYHLQSDLDVSASEVEDSASTARLDVINKEQLYDAYRKALDRYQKYRSRYADLAKKYKDLETDSTKARSVLVETQEKAIRRINELREQCALEQQAKAHLEEALRVEMDDMQCKMQAYQTKLTLLGENPDSIMALTKNEPLIQLNATTNQTTTDPNNLINLDVENTTNHNDQSHLEKQVAEQQNQIKALTQKLDEANKTIDLMKQQEEENAISLAQTKQAIYSELESKETQVLRLKTNLTEVDSKYQQTLKENNQISGQVKELEELKEKLKTITLAKQEAEAKLISSNHMQGETKQQIVAKDKFIAGLEEKLQDLSKKYDDQMKDLRHQNEQLSEMIRQYQNSEISIAEIDNELNRTKTENNGLQETISENQRKIKEIQSEIEENRKELDKIQGEKENLRVLGEESKQKNEELNKELEEVRKEKNESEIRLKQLESEIKILNDQSVNTESETIVALKEALQKAKSEADVQMKEIKEELTAKEKELKSATNKLGKLKKQLETKESEGREEIERLRQSITEYESNLAQIQNEHQQHEEAMEREKSELKAQVTNILQEIGTMEAEIRNVRASHSELEAEKRSLEQKFESKTKESDDQQRWKSELDESLEKLKLVEQKLQNIESESSQLAEKNCLLEENSNRLEKLIAEYERKRCESETEVTHLKQQYETSEENIQKLNEKMAQVLDENSRLHNAKELMEHEHRSLQDQCESREKEKLCVLDSNKCLEDELKVIKEEIESLTRENNNLSEMSNNLRGDLSDALEKVRVEEDKNEKLMKAKEHLEKELKAAKENGEEKQMVEELQKKMAEFELMSQEKIKLAEDQALELQRKLDEYTKESEEHDKSNEELSELREKVHELQQQLQDSKTQNEALSERLSSSQSEISALSEKLNAANESTTKLTATNEALKSEINSLENNKQSHLAELESRLQQASNENQNLQETARNATDLEKKLQNYEQLQLENEYLHTLTEQLQADIRSQSEDRANVAIQITALNEKINSQRCELYVLNENQEKHNSEVEAKCKEILKAQEEVEQLKQSLETQRSELTRQSEHADFITAQNDNIQKELLSCQHQLAEVEKELREVKIVCEEVTGEKLKLIDQLASAEALSKQQIDNLKVELERSGSTLETLNKEVDDLNKEIEKVDALKEEKNEMLKQIEALKVELTEKVPSQVKVESVAESTKASQHESENLRKINEQLQKELEDLQYKSRGEIANLTEEIDDLLTNAKHMSEKLAQYENQERNPSPPSTALNVPVATEEGSSESIEQEKKELESKLKTIMHDVQDVSNRNLFLEQKCENYLILEQSNERLKSQNEKLSRQLDETLHNEGVTVNTEFEYLKNIMFQYLTGTLNGNNETLVKVISAVLKFTPQQTQVAIEKEHQRRSLLGQLNKLL
ncbi:myosin-7 isoform X2 [Eupeodes corollae]|uniref:myosin-7 isoform X2 n=1 Tax=Eupeodes corollae TaxID=290404 RepID=UPI002492C276|nr:myosin-7 isoform X2 [Eupeodes corollae]